MFPVWYEQDLDMRITQVSYHNPIFNFIYMLLLKGKTCEPSNHRRRGILSVVSVVCCQVEVSATGR